MSRESVFGKMGTVFFFQFRVSITSYASSLCMCKHGSRLQMCTLKPNEMIATQLRAISAIPVLGTYIV